ncbi:MAG: DUF2085 domain-containing protein [Chloroflexota bacterium]
MQEDNFTPRPHAKFHSILMILILTGIITLWLIYTPQGFLGKADAVGYAVCHRISERSLSIAGRQMPMCARCTGMYLGAMIGLIYQFLRRPKHGRLPSHNIILFMGILAFIWGVDGVNSYFHLFPSFNGIYEPNNVLRLLTGSGIGISAAILLFPAFNQTFWQDWKTEPAIETIQELLYLLCITLIIDGLVLLENPWILFPAAILSAIGTLFLLTMVYGMIWLIVVKRESYHLHISDAWIPLSIGLTIAIVQIGIMDWGRLWLTGTWSGLLFK